MGETKRWCAEYGGFESKFGFKYDHLGSGVYPEEGVNSNLKINEVLENA
jgi:hypothetical protein